MGLLCHLNTWLVGKGKSVRWELEAHIPGRTLWMWRQEDCRSRAKGQASLVPVGRKLSEEVMRGQGKEAGSPGEPFHWPLCLATAPVLWGPLLVG